MKREELLKKIESLPAGIEVCIFDHKRNLAEDSGDGTGEGIYPIFDVEVLTKKDVVSGTKPFAILSFDNTDYDAPF